MKIEFRDDPGPPASSKAFSTEDKDFTYPIQTWTLVGFSVFVSSADKISLHALHDTKEVLHKELTGDDLTVVYTDLKGIDAYHGLIGAASYYQTMSNFFKGRMYEL
jgi:hypothetical protein